MPGDRRHLPQAGREARALLLRLSRLVLVELPDAAVLLEDRARIHALRTRAAIGLLTGIRRCADVDVEPAVAVEGNALVLVLTIGGEAGDDRLGRAGRLELPGGQLHPLDRLRMREVDIAIAQRDAGRAAAAERLFDLEAAVAVGVAQRDRPAAGLRLTAAAARHQRDVEIAIGRHGHVPRGSEVVGHDQRAESWRQREAAVIGIAHRPGLSADAGDQKPERGDRATIGHCTCSAEIHNVFSLLERA